MKSWRKLDCILLKALNGKCSDPIALLRCKLMHLPEQWATEHDTLLSSPCSARAACLRSS